MKIRIISIGKTKNVDINSIIKKYLKKISFFIEIEEIEIKESSFTKESTENIDKILSYEAKEIRKYLDNSYNVALCIEGEQIDSVILSKKIDDITSLHSSKKFLNFIIGGSYGISQEIKSLVNWKLSFSKMTFNHQIFKVILLEQIYRSFTIIKNITYHK